MDILFFIDVQDLYSSPNIPMLGLIVVKNTGDTTFPLDMECAIMIYK